jgi:radical SAM protein with 4Fe4S-binding SPASM domain
MVIKEEFLNMTNFNEHAVTSFVFSKKGKQLSNRRVLYHIKERLSIKNPISVALCPTSTCVRKCTFCSNTQRNKINNGKDYSSEVFENILTDLKNMNVKGVSVAGGGEPLTYDKEKLHKFFSQKDIKYKIGLHTNGVNLDYIFDREILEKRNINYINVSVVANNAELYKKVTGGSEEQFNKIKENLIKGINKKSFPTLGVKILLCRENYMFVKDIYDYFKGIGISNVLLRCVGNFEKNQDIELNQYQVNKLKDILNNSLNLDISQINMILGQPDIKNLPVPSKCWINILGYTAGIDPDGETYLCSPWSRKEFSIGNVNENSFSNIWGNDKHRETINSLNIKLKSGKCNPLKCRHYFSNLAIDAYIAGTLKSLPIKEISNNYGMFI